MITNEQFNEEMEHEEPKVDLVQMVADLQKELQKLKQSPKNQRPGKPGERNRYVRLGELKMWGKVPLQQRDLAEILTRSMDVGKEYSEAEVFAFLVDGSSDYRSLTASKQDVTYLFKYYRGLKKNATHAGFILRGFLKIV